MEKKCVGPPPSSEALQWVARGEVVPEIVVRRWRTRTRHGTRETSFISDARGDKPETPAGSPASAREGTTCPEARGAARLRNDAATAPLPVEEKWEARRRFGVALSLAALYLIWGSTYLAIRFAIETLPPLLMASVRFLVAGGILYLWARARGAPRPTWTLWRTAALSGLLLLMGGNGAVVWAEQFIPSGLAALLIATVPLWLVLLDWASGRGPAPGLGVTFGILWGFTGVALLVSGSEIGGAGPRDLLGGVVVLMGAVSWAAGSLVARYGPRPVSASLGNGMQILAGGAGLLVAGVLAGEWDLLRSGAVSWLSLSALLYLIVFGSLVGFSAYIWLLRNTTPAVASTYAYVNPVVALVLGWGLAEEPLSLRTGLAAFVILTAVLIITTRRTSTGLRRGADGPEAVQPGSSRGMPDWMGRKGRGAGRSFPGKRG